MASLNAERSEMRELLTNAGGSSAANDAEDDDAGRAARQREIDRQISAAAAELGQG